MISLRRLSRRSLQDLPDERVQVLPLANGPGGQALGLRATESDTERERDLSVRGWLALMGHRRSDHLVSRPAAMAGVERKSTVGAELVTAKNETRRVLLDNGVVVFLNRDTKARYAFVFGDFRRLHRMGLIACYYRAAEWEHTEVMIAAHKLLLYLDKSKA